ncbi:MAG: hypothetical protein ACYCV4_02535 [Dermatophilaceae bacterium]
MTIPVTPAQPKPTTPAAALNKLIDVLVGDLLASRNVSKLFSWGTLAAAAVFHSTLGPDISLLLGSIGGVGSVVHVVADTRATPAP